MNQKSSVVQILKFVSQVLTADIIGRDAVLAKRAAGLKRRLVQSTLTDPDPLLFHNEPILRDGEVVGYLSSGTYGHALDGAVGLGYVPCKGETASELLASDFEIDIAEKQVRTEASSRPLYDAQGVRLRG